MNSCLNEFYGLVNFAFDHVTILKKGFWVGPINFQEMVSMVFKMRQKYHFEFILICFPTWTSKFGLKGKPLRSKEIHLISENFQIYSFSKEHFNKYWIGPLVFTDKRPPIMTIGSQGYNNNYNKLEHFTVIRIKKNL